MVRNYIMGIISPSHNHPKIKITNYEKYQDDPFQVISSKNFWDFPFAKALLWTKNTVFCATVLIKWAKFWFNCSFRSGLGSNFQAAVFLWIIPSGLFMTYSITKCHKSSWDTMYCTMQIIYFTKSRFSFLSFRIWKQSQR